MKTLIDLEVQTPKTIRTKIYSAQKNHEYTLIQKSEAECWKQLRERSAWYDPSEEHLWSVSVSEEEVAVAEGINRYGPVVEESDHGESDHGESDHGESDHGESAEERASNLGLEGVYVSWWCPYCEVEHVYEQDIDDQSPYLWYCENGNGIALVHVNDV